MIPSVRPRPSPDGVGRGPTSLHDRDPTPKPHRRSSGALPRRRKPLPWPDDRVFRILSIDGGGIRGIFSAAILDGLERQYLGGASVSAYFDLIVGTSTGGIIALGLGTGRPAADMLDLYVRHGAAIFPPGRAGRLAREALGWLRAKYRRRPLTRYLAETFGDLRLCDSRARLCVPSADGRHGDLYVFKTPHHPDFVWDAPEPMSRVALATSAAPTYFRALDDGRFTLVDGGLWANNPIMVAVVEAMSSFAVSRDRIRVLSIGCGAAHYTISTSQRRFGGLLHWRRAIDAAIHFQSQSALAQARLLVGPENVVRLDAPPDSPRIDLDDWRRSANFLPSAASEVLTTDADRVASLFLKEATAPYRPVTRVAS